MKTERAFKVERDMTRPSGPAYGWVIVAAGALMTCVSISADVGR
jgi:hypothetical protein